MHVITVGTSLLRITEREAQFLKKSQVMKRRVRDETDGSCVTVVLTPHEGGLEHKHGLVFKAAENACFMLLEASLKGMLRISLERKLINMITAHQNPVIENYRCEFLQERVMSLVKFVWP